MRWEERLRDPPTFPTTQRVPRRRQSDGERAAATRLALDRHRATVRRDDMLHHREPDARALMRSRIGRRATHEFPENIALLVGRDASPRSSTWMETPSLRRPTRTRIALPVGEYFDGVVQQVPQRVLQRIGIDGLERQ